MVLPGRRIASGSPSKKNRLESPDREHAAHRQSALAELMVKGSPAPAHGKTPPRQAKRKKDDDSLATLTSLFPLVGRQHPGLMQAGGSEKQN